MPTGAMRTASIFWCTVTGMSALVAVPPPPVAVTLIVAVPVEPFMQLIGVVTLSHVPAHTKPLFDTLTTPPVTAYVKVVFPTVLPFLSLAVDVRPDTSPGLRDRLVGVTVTLATGPMLPPPWHP